MKPFPIVIAALCLASCCRDNERKNYFLSDDHRSQVPYVDNQALTFTSVSGEEFNVQVKRADATQKLTFYGCAECCDRRVNLEVDVIEFTGSTFLTFPVVAIMSWTDKSNNGSIVFFTQQQYEKMRGGNSEAVNNAGNLFFLEDFVFECDDHFAECLQNVTIQNNTYETVYKVFIEEAVFVRVRYYFYFTTTEGIVKIDRVLYDVDDNEKIVAVEEYFAD